MALLIARAFVLVTVLAVLERAHVWSLKNYPETIRSWDSVYSLGSLVLMFSLWIWVLFALRPRATTAAAVAGVAGGLEGNDVLPKSDQHLRRSLSTDTAPYVRLAGKRLGEERRPPFGDGVPHEDHPPLARRRIAERHVGVAKPGEIRPVGAFLLGT